ncbi:MAG: sodium:solute symporter [Sphaerobacteraceae bacterium]|nr:MAG: sodium:solute symporter [Sphaerobacteraceae bacterium]
MRDELLVDALSGPVLLAQANGDNGPTFELATIDYVIVALYIVGILFLGFWVGRGKKSAEDFLLGGRIAIWPLIGFGLMAANMSGTSYIGIAGAGYEEGIAVWNYEWMATLVLLFFALFVLPFYLRSKVNTMPEFLEKRYDRRSRYVFSGFSVFTAMFIDSAGALFAGAITLQLLFPDMPLSALITILALLAGAYVILGGLRAVMITDTVQGVLLLIAGLIIFVTLFIELGSWDAVRNAAPEDGFTVAPSSDDEFLPWPGIFTGVLWLGFYYWITNHVVVQKVLAARDINHGRWGALFAGALQLPLLFLLVLPGVMGREIYPDLAEADQIWQALVFDFMPIGLRGLIFAALVAALMSTLDSVLNGASSLVVNDFIKTRKRQFTDRALLLMSRGMIGVFMIIAALWAPVLTEFDTIVEYFQAFLGHITMPVVVIFLGGLFWARGTRQAAFVTLLIGFPVGLVAFLTGQLFELYTLQFLYATGLMLLLSATIYIGVSLMTPAPATEDVGELMWSREHWHQETEELNDLPLWQNPRILAIVIAIVTVAMVVFFI